MKILGTKILGIESSCDETAAAVYCTERKLLSSVLNSQIALHGRYGGTVPEIASREHIRNIRPIVEEALQQAGVTIDDIDVIAVTNKPGLPGSLLIGLSFAKGLAWAAHKKLIGVNHLEGHAFSAFLDHPDIPFPHLCLTASGGHTSLYKITDFGAYTVLGQTVDDAAGEAFDKIAKLIGLPYPGGPLIEKLAQEINFEDVYHYPRGKKKGLDFSFSGLKTAVLYDMVTRGFYDLPTKTILPTLTPDVQKKIASSLLVCIKDIFIHKLTLALQEHPEIKAVTFVGGVACNKYIRAHLLEFCAARGLALYIPAPRYCTDNAAMIAYVGHYKAQRSEYNDLTLDIF
jgi:N6-L-threonylcarbamoyladenine synthase